MKNYKTNLKLTHSAVCVYVTFIGKLINIVQTKVYCIKTF